MIDVIYFDRNDDSEKLQEEFISEVKDKFENVRLIDAYDPIKGYRQEVHLPKEEKESYQIWLFGSGWHSCSFMMKLKEMNKEEHEEIYRLIDLAKEKYPECVKEEVYHE